MARQILAIQSSTTEQEMDGEKTPKTCHGPQLRSTPERLSSPRVCGGVWVNGWWMFGSLWSHAWGGRLDGGGGEAKQRTRLALTLGLHNLIQRTHTHTQCCEAMEAGTQDTVADGKGTGSGSAVWKDITEVRRPSPCNSLRCLSALCITPTHRVRSPLRQELDRPWLVMAAGTSLPFYLPFSPVPLSLTLPSSTNPTSPRLLFHLLPSPNQLGMPRCRQLAGYGRNDLCTVLFLARVYERLGTDGPQDGRILARGRVEV